MTVPLAPPEPVERALLAADLHLDGSDEPRRRFRTLLARTRDTHAALFLLGDVFHYWFGRAQLSLPTYRTEVHLLRATTGLGTHVTIVPGNRDFLLDEAFERATGARVAPDALLIETRGECVHLSHGDLFGLADVRYQRMRRVLHSAPVRALARSLPTRTVDGLARRLRRHSEAVVAEKSAEVLAPDRGSVAGLFREGVDVVVCGHFHEARDETFPAEEGGGRFRVLEPFEEEGYVLEVGPEGWREERLFPRGTP